MVDLTQKYNIKTLEYELEFPLDIGGQDVGALGGLMAGSRELVHGNIHIQGIDERILVGESVTAPLEGIGVFIGKDGDDYEFRVGDPDGNYIHWDGTDLTIKGDMTAGSITGVDITGGTIIGATIKTSASGARVQLNADESNIYLYDGGGDQVLLIDDNGTIVGIVTGDGRDLAIGSDDVLILNADNQVYISSDTNSVYITSDNASIIMEAHLTIAMLSDLDMFGNDINDVGYIYADHFVGPLTGNASTATYATSAGSAGSASTANLAYDLSATSNIDLNSYSINSVNTIYLNNLEARSSVVTVYGQFRSSSRTAVDKGSSPGGTYSLEVSNSNGNGKALADAYDEYSESTEIEKVAPMYKIKDKEEASKKSLAQILKRAEYKVNAGFNNPDTKVTREEHAAELNRVLKVKDWSEQVLGEVEGERVSLLEWGTLLAFSDKGAIPTTVKGQTNIMGVVASYPSRTAHVQDKGIAVCKTGKTYLKVVGKCSVGSLLQASDIEGCAEEAPSNVSIGSFVGRSRVEKNNPQVEVIEVDLN